MRRVSRRGRWRWCSCASCRPARTPTAACCYMWRGAASRPTCSSCCAARCGGGVPALRLHNMWGHARRRPGRGAPSCPLHLAERHAVSWPDLPAAPHIQPAPPSPQDIVKVGVGAHGDALKVQRDFGFEMGGVLELSEFANARLCTDGVPPIKWSLAGGGRAVGGRRRGRAAGTLFSCHRKQALPPRAPRSANSLHSGLPSSP